jgi:DNA primase
MEIPEIKQRLTIGQVLAHYGLTPDKNRRLHCPFHDDKTPSLQVYEKTGTVYCFAASCPTHGQSMDVIDFICRKEGCTKHAALEKCKALIAASPLTGGSAAPLAGQPKAEPADYDQLLRGFAANLKRSPGAQAYCAKRMLNPAMGIGYNATGWPQLKHCLIFPLVDAAGRTVSLYGRSVYDNNSSRHFYLSDRKGLYPGYPAPHKTALILTESVIDAATLLQIEAISSAYNLLALYGTGGLTDEHIEAIRGLPGLGEVILWFDGDAAGNAAIRKQGQRLQTLLPGVRITRVPMPDGEDINSLAQAHDNPRLFTDLLDSRMDFFLSSEPSSPATPVQPDSNTPADSPPAPAAPAGMLDSSNPEQLQYKTDHLQISVLGGVSTEHLERLRVTLYLRRNPHLNPTHSIRQSVDLYQDDLLEKFIRRAAEKLELSTTLLTAALSTLTEQLDHWRQERTAQQNSPATAPRVLTPNEQAAALERLKSPQLMAWTMQRYQDSGIVGEAVNAMILHQVMVSRLQDDPVSVICLSASGSGKSYLLEKVAQCFPSELFIENTQMSENSFYYFRRDQIKGKIFLIEDMDGARNVEYPIRELISKKRISKTVTLKDNRGVLRTVTLTVEGPVTFCGCTTREKLYEDNANRCLLIYLDQGADQDQRIMSYHRRLRAGLIDKTAEERVRDELRQLQQLLRPRPVLNPYAPLIELPPGIGKPRRTLGLLLSFIDSITLYHQYQCDRDAGGALLTHPEHIQWGLRLLEGVLFAKSDELSAPLRHFLETLRQLVAGGSSPSFYAQDIRRPLRMAPRTLSRYLYELQQYGYIRICGGNKYRKGYEYLLVGETQHLPGTIQAHSRAIMDSVWKAWREQSGSRPVRPESAKPVLADSTS